MWHFEFWHDPLMLVIGAIGGEALALCINYGMRRRIVWLSRKSEPVAIARPDGLVFAEGRNRLVVLQGGKK